MPEDQESLSLQDQLEDAYFSMLMARFAAVQGERLREENKRLSTKPSDLPDDLDVRVDAAMRRELRKRDFHMVSRITRRIVSRVAMAVLVIVALFSLLCVTSSAFRQKVLNLVVEWQQKYTSFQIVEEPTTGVPHEPYWIPEGYELVEESKNGLSKKYSNGDSDYFSIRFIPGGRIGAFDTENVVSLSNITCKENTGIAFSKDGREQVVLADQANKVIINIIGNRLDRDTLICVLTSMY